MGTFDAEQVNDVWERLVADPALFEAAVTGDLDRFVAAHDLGDDERAILDELAATPEALQWNVANLRYRASLETMLKLRRWMPLTTALLTDGRTDWLMDLCFEYLTHHRWDELGHRHFAECLRFADFIDRRVAQRRPLPAHLDTALRYEAAICRMLASTADQREPADATTAPVGVDPAALAIGCPRPAPTTVVIELAEDISSWIAAGRPTATAPAATPLTVLGFVPPRGDLYWAIALDDDQLDVFRRCTGASPGKVIAEAAARSRGVLAADVLALLGAWVGEGALTLAPQHDASAQNADGS